MQVVIVGTGNVATVLGKVIQSAGHKIMQVLGRNEQNAKVLATIFGCESGHDITTAYKNADVYLFAISDNALHHLYQNVHLGNNSLLNFINNQTNNVFLK
jgi:predicted dinucleotide-binding enzyme